MTNVSRWHSLEVSTLGFLALPGKYAHSAVFNSAGIGVMGAAFQTHRPGCFFAALKLSVRGRRKTCAGESGWFFGHAQAAVTIVDAAICYCVGYNQQLLVFGTGATREVNW